LWRRLYGVAGLGVLIVRKSSAPLSPAARAPVPPVAAEAFTILRSSFRTLRLLGRRRNRIRLGWCRAFVFRLYRFRESGFRRCFRRGDRFYFLTLRIAPIRKLLPWAPLSSSVTAPARTAFSTVANRGLFVDRVDVFVFFEEIRNIEKRVTFQT
jgi:hypothetical protein